MAKRKESNSSSSCGPIETVTILYSELHGQTFDMGQSSTSSSDRSQTSTSQESSGSSVGEEVFAEVDLMRDMEKTIGYVPLGRSVPTSEGPEMEALDYFQTRNIFPLFTFLMSHLLVHSPDEPIPFLTSLVDRCLKYRDQKADPPLLFEDSHVHSVYTALDPIDDGAIDFQQYVNGMITLGVADFETMPEGMLGRKRNIPKEVFIREAKKALLNQLDLLVNKPKRTRFSSVK